MSFNKQPALNNEKVCEEVQLNEAELTPCRKTNHFFPTMNSHLHKFLNELRMSQNHIPWRFGGFLARCHGYLTQKPNQVMTPMISLHGVRYATDNIWTDFKAQTVTAAFIINIYNPTWIPNEVD